MPQVTILKNVYNATFQNRSTYKVLPFFIIVYSGTVSQAWHKYNQDDEFQLPKQSIVYFKKITWLWLDSNPSLAKAFS